MDHRIKRWHDEGKDIAKALYQDHDIDVTKYSEILGHIKELEKCLLRFDESYDAKRKRMRS